MARLAAGGWAGQTAEQELASGRWDLLILDEVFLALSRGFLELAELRSLIADKPDGMHLILTGRGCPPEICEPADTVTEMKAVKHHMRAGHRAQTGIEF